MTTRLILSLDEQQLGEFELGAETLTIGRRPESDIHIDDLAVSGQHARLLTTAGECLLEDLDSTNGTFVNGERVGKRRLALGDLITIGKHALRFMRAEGAVDAPPVNDGFAETMGTNAEETTALRQADTTAEAARARQTEVESGSAAPVRGIAANIGPARLRLFMQGGGDKELPLSKALTTIGKPDVQIAAISRRQNGDFIVHVDGGENNAARPIVNGEVIGVKSQQLADGDVIEIAGMKMRYRLG